MSRQFLRIKAKKVLKDLKKTRPEFKNFTLATFWPLFLATEKNQAKIKDSLINLDSFSENDIEFDSLDEDQIVSLEDEDEDDSE